MVSRTLGYHASSLLNVEILSSRISSTLVAGTEKKKKMANNYGLFVCKHTQSFAPFRLNHLVNYSHKTYILITFLIRFQANRYVPMKNELC